MEDAPSVARSSNNKKRKAGSEDPSPPKKAKILEESNVIYVAKLPIGLDEDGLKKEFACYGQVLSARIPQPPRGYGFVEFVDKSSAAAAVADTEKEIDGSIVRLSWSSTPIEKEPAPVLHVANLSPDATEDGIRAAFGEYGIVLRVCLRTGAGSETQKQPSGSANVEFSNEASADDARKALNETELFGHKIHVEFATSGRRGVGKC